ncbi:MAG: cupin domain-containing protein [Dehalococcoidia bacterium]
MEAFEIDEVLAAHRQAGELYHEFLRADTLSAGMYVLPAGAADPQQPHTEDEVYYVVEGQGVLRVGEEDRPVGPGSIAFVGTGVAHRFHSITQDLKILVIFAPPRRSRAVAD